MYDPNLQHSYLLARETNPRAAAEMAYVLSVLAVRAGDYASAHRFGLESIILFRELQISTEEDAETLFFNLNGVLLPDLIHEKVVRDRLSLMGVVLE